MESSSLPSEHRRVLDRVVEFFRDYPGAVGGYVSGSVARGVADEYSDLDVGIFFADEAATVKALARGEPELAADLLERGYVRVGLVPPPSASPEAGEGAC